MGVCDRDIFDVIAAVGSIATAIFSYLVWRVYTLQLETQKKQLQHSVSERYEANFNILQEGISEIIESNRVTYKAYHLFKQAKNHADLFLAKEVIQELQSILEKTDKALDLEEKWNELSENNDERKKINHEKTELRKQLFKIDLTNLYQKYLNIDLT